MLRFNHAKLKQTMEEILRDIDLNADSIFHVTTSQVETSLRGTDSHGINLFPHYVRAIKAGRISKNPQFIFDDRSETTSILDADHAIGHHSGAIAMLHATEKAKKYGMGSVAVKNSTHLGAAAYFGLMAATQGCLGFAFTNADALVKVTNAKESFFGTNPICFTAPLLNEEPLCLDMATSLVSWNKIRNYRMANEDIPNYWAFDAEGQAVTNPHDARSLAPSGDYKGYGLGLMIDVLTSLLTGSLISKDIKPMFTSDIKEKRKVGHFFMAIDITKYIPIEVFKQNLQSMVDRIRLLEPLNNDEVMVPGDPEKKSRLIRLESGIPIDEIRYQEFLQISDNFSQCIING